MCTPHTSTTLIRYVMLHFRDQRGDASLVLRISSATTVFFCENRSPIRYDFRSRRKRYRVWCELSLKLWNPVVYMEKLWYFYKRSFKNRARNEINMIFRFRKSWCYFKMLHYSLFFISTKSLLTVIKDH